MDRKRTKVPAGMIHRWGRTPVSCHLCRAKKLRCDRAHPCSNCVQRKVNCVYSGQGGFQSGRSTTPIVKLTGHRQAVSTSIVENNENALQDRVRRLEEIIMQGGNQVPQVLSTEGPPRATGVLDEDGRPDLRSNSSSQLIPLDTCLRTRSGRDEDRLLQFGTPIPANSPLATLLDLNVPLLTKFLPSLEQATDLFNHFARCLQPTFGVLHIPSTRTLMQQLYQVLLDGDEPDLASLALVYAIFAGAALAWTTEFLEALHATPAEAKTAFSTYSRVALLILDDHQQALPLSTIALEALCTLGYVLTHTDGFSHKLQTLRIRQLLMARALQIHRLDSAKCIEERRLKGCNLIETEVKRRIWWHMVASDWIFALSSGPQEGTYLLQPKHMNVNRPSNVDDEFVSAPGAQHGFPLTIPTSMSAFLYRVHLAELCREIVDVLPPGLFESPETWYKEVDYNIILDLDKRIQSTLANLPIYFKLDPASIQQSLSICHQRPYIAYQRTFLHFGINTRICRLHRPFHLEGFGNPQYAYSRSMCVRSAETVLSLRQSLDDVGALINLNPSRFWVVVQHVYHAAIILATEVSLNPQSPEAAARKEEVLAACRMLERSKHESAALKKAIQKNTQTLRMILQNQAPVSKIGPMATKNCGNSRLPDTGGQPNLSSNIDSLYIVNPSVPAVSTFTGTEQEVYVPGASEWPDTFQDQSFDDDTWGKLWSDVFDVGLELDVPDWNSILGDLAPSDEITTSSQIRLLASLDTIPAHTHANVAKTYIPPWFMCKDPTTERISTSIMPENDSSISFLQDLNLLSKSFQAARNAVPLCATCHRGFTSPLDPGLIFYPKNLELFIQFELYTRSQRKRAESSSGQTPLKQRAPTATQYATYQNRPRGLGMYTRVVLKGDEDSGPEVLSARAWGGEPLAAIRRAIAVLGSPLYMALPEKDILRDLYLGGVNGDATAEEVGFEYGGFGDNEFFGLRAILAG
ncbi:Zn(II)2Cys6 transcription factor [Aspergillus mulundensis]|uniref:Putative Zn(II)2Cys6 transcription factor n=1 Tax=Aspergillus mulundensis TaxID=1810919 RepID=A0A3D8R4N8_9EURO|nr:putative Zn(II)2Cys6 transcription factor [Aspergillus mulundensis]RDW68946.1 putative Zn(II)2Cys6 transcription factor [Aspergillus mulundensis]